MPRKVLESVPGADPDRGAALIAHYPEVTEEQAGRRTRAVYLDIQRSMRVPFVNGVFRALANHLDFLEASWAEVAPFVRTARFERDADRLRTLALVRPLPAAEHLAVDLAQVRGAERIRDYTDTVHYALPRLLLAAELIDLTLVRSPRTGTKALPKADVPLGPAPGTVGVRLVRPKKLRGSRRNLLDDIQTTHGHPFVAGYYRGLARWPLVLDAVWSAIKPTVATGPYVDGRRRLVQEAYRLGSRYAVRGIDLEAVGLDDTAVGELRDVLCLYRTRLVPDLLLDASLVKALLEGEKDAVGSRFSAVPSAPRTAIKRRRAPARARTRVQRSGRAERSGEPARARRSVSATRPRT